MLVIGGLGVAALPARDLALALPNNGTSGVEATQRQGLDTIARGIFFSAVRGVDPVPARGCRSAGNKDRAHCVCPSIPARERRPRGRNHHANRHPQHAPCRVDPHRAQRPHGIEVAAAESDAFVNLRGFYRQRNKRKRWQRKNYPFHFGCTLSWQFV